MTDSTSGGPLETAWPPRPSMPSITASVLAESRLLVQAVAAWLVRS
jgi:hypothetical protein